MSAIAVTREGLDRKPFRLLLGGYVASSLTDGLAPIVTTIEILRIDPSPWSLSTVLIALWLGRILVIPISGRLAALHNPIAVMISADAIRITAQVGLLAAVLAVGNSVTSMTIAALVYGAGIGIYLPAQQTAIPALVGHTALERSNATLSAVTDVSLIAGPALGILAMKALGYAGVLVLDCVTFAINIALLAWLIALSRSRDIDWTQEKVDSASGFDTAREEPAMTGTVRSAYRTVRTDQFLFASLVFWTLASVVIGMIAVYAPTRVIGLSGDAGGWAVISTVMAISSFVGSVVAAAAGSRLPYRVGVLCTGTFLIVQIFAISGGLAADPVVVVATYALFGAGALLTTWSGILWTSAIQRRLPRTELAKFFAVESALTGAGVPIGMMLGPVLTLSGGLWLFSGIGIALLAAALAVTRTPTRRRTDARA